MSIDVSTFIIPPIGSDPGDASRTAREQINNRLNTIQSDLNDLATRISQTTGKNALIRQYAPLSADAFTGALVYYDTTTHVFTPALARLLGIPGDQGQSIEAECARVEGIVLSKYTDNSNNVVGTLLLGGSWQDDVSQGCPVLTGALGVSAAAIPGVYYLSDTSAGQCTSNPGVHLRQPLISNHGNGSFSLSIFYMAHDNHFHGSCELAGTWVSVANRLPDGVSAPSGAVFWYDGNADPYYIGIGELSAETTAVFYEGVLQRSSDNFVVAYGYLWYTGTTAPESYSVSIFNHYPFAYGSPVMRSIESANDALTVTANNGRVVLHANDFVSGSMARNAVAVSAISGNTVQFTPVVSGLAAGPGISLNSEVNGTVTVSSSRYVNVPLDAYSIFHKGTNIVCDDDFLYVSFPANRVSSLVMSLPVTDVPDSTALRAYAYCCGLGSGGTFSVNFFWLPQPAITAPGVLSHTPLASTTLAFAGSYSDTVTYAETPVGADISGSGQLYARIAITNAPQTEVRLMRVGFKLEVVDASETTPEVMDVVSVNAIINTMLAGATIAKYDCLRSVDGRLGICNSGHADMVNQCIGIAIDNGNSGQDVRYLIQGIIENTGFSFTPGAPIYISPYGTMTQTDPSTDSGAAYIQRIGVALTSSIVQIDISTGIIKE